ncbi:MAG: CapA family protein [Bacillota bacterium]
MKYAVISLVIVLAVAAGVGLSYTAQDVRDVTVAVEESLLLELNLEGDFTLLAFTPDEDPLSLDADIVIFHDFEGVGEELFRDYRILITPTFSKVEHVPVEAARTIMWKGAATLPDGTPVMPPGSSPTAARHDKMLFGDWVLVGRLDDLTVGTRPVRVGDVCPLRVDVRSPDYPASCAVSMYVRPPSTDLLSRLIHRSHQKRVKSVAATLKEHLKPQGETPVVTLKVAGDLMFDRGVRKVIHEHGWEYPLELVAGFLSSADVTLANLESPLGVLGRRLPGKLIWFRADPEMVNALVQASIDVVTIANNHILDYDTENFLETLDILEEHGVMYVGGGRNLEHARKPGIIEKKGVKIAFVGYSEFAHPDLFWSYSYPRTFEAKENLPGVLPIDKTYIAEDVQRAKALGADIVIACFHWGMEDVNVPVPFRVDQREIAKYAIDVGVDLVLGFHPHALQGIEVYKGKYIVYSMGNFVMDQKRDIQRESMILTFGLTRDGIKSLEVTPVYITDCRPHILEGADARNLLSRIRDYSLRLVK